MLRAVHLAVFKGFIALFAADGAALIIYRFLRTGSRRFQIGGICFLYIIVAAFRTPAVIKNRGIGCSRQLPGIPFLVNLRMAFKRLRINGHAEQSADITATGHIFAIAVRMLIMTVILVDNSVIVKRLSRIFKAQTGRNDRKIICLCRCFVICLDNREVLIGIILPGTPRPNLMNHQTCIRTKALDILDQLRQIGEAGSIKRRIAFLLEDNNIPVHVFQGFLNGCAFLRIRRVPVRSFLFYGRTLSGGIGDFKFKYSLVVGCRLVMPGNRTRRKLEITKSQRTTVHRSNFRRITRSVFRKAVADGQNLERIIWFRFFAGILRTPQLELLRTGVSAGGQTDDGDIFCRFADLHIHRLVKGHRNAVRDNAFVLIQILCGFRGVYPVAVRQAVERRINPQMIESIACIKGVLCPVIPFRRGLPVIMLRRIPVTQRADHIRDRITAVHIAAGNIHGDPAGGRDRVASVLAAEQIFGLYRLSLLHLTVELKLLRAGVVQRVVNGDHRHALDFPVERDGGRRRFAVHIVCNDAFLSIQRIRIVGRIYPIFIGVLVVAEIHYHFLDIIQVVEDVLRSAVVVVDPRPVLVPDRIAVVHIVNVLCRKARASCHLAGVHLHVDTA